MLAAIERGVSSCRLLHRGIHSQYVITNEINGTREITLNHEITNANFGIFCSTPGIAVGRCVPKSRAMYMLLTGLPLSAHEAYNSGLVTKVVPASQLEEEVNKIVESIKHKSRSVIAIGKEFYYKQIDMKLLDAYDLGEKIMVENINMDDGQEGIKSFVEKRRASWHHK